MPERFVLIPGRQFLDHNIGTGKEKRCRQVVPNRKAAEEDEMQIIRERMCRVVGKSQIGVTPGPQNLAVQTFDRDRIRLKRSAPLTTGDAGESNGLGSCRSFRNDILEMTGMPGPGEQHAAKGKMERKSAQSVPAGQASTGINRVI